MIFSEWEIIILFSDYHLSHLGTNYILLKANKILHSSQSACHSHRPINAKSNFQSNTDHRCKASMKILKWMSLSKDKFTNFNGMKFKGTSPVTYKHFQHNRILIECNALNLYQTLHLLQVFPHLLSIPHTTHYG